jgi:hypothetical protein
MDHQTLYQKRDAKVKPHLAQYAPVWIVDEQIREEDESIQFNVVFRHNLYQWVNRRYLYDGFNDVLYHKGQRTIREDEAVDVQEEDPYILPTVADTPNSYGG